MPDFMPKKVCFLTVGCRLNQYETERMAADLGRFGFERVRGGPADLYVINTCTVTHKADRDSRYLARKAKRDNPNSKVVLVGCYVETGPEAIAALQDVDAVIRNNEKDQVAQLLPLRLPELFSSCRPTAGAGLSDFYQRNRAWIKISDGCNQTCAYCLVTVVRGNLACRPATEILAEIRSLVTVGFQEVVLTAVNMGYYQDSRFDPPIKSLAGLCRVILDQTGIYRLRLSSIEPQAVSQELTHLCNEAGNRLCRHWHIPLQSGSDRILRLMRRPYDREQFASLVRSLKQLRSGTVVGADVMVGFPGETDDDFEASCELVQRAPLDYLHVFSYSDRPGTAAATLPDKVPPHEIYRRARELGRISRELLDRAGRSQIGEVLEVISEFKPEVNGRHLGISDNYLHVVLPPGMASGKRVVRVKIERVLERHLEGQLMDRKIERAFRAD
jgi:threonylcarbamoyladenosine tRNA methylthiotransferase MtaB